MPILVALLLGIAALAFVLYPLYRRPARVPEAGHPQGLSLSGVQGEKPPCRRLGCPQNLSFFFPRRRRRREWKRKERSPNPDKCPNDDNCPNRPKKGQGERQEVPNRRQVKALADLSYREPGRPQGDAQ